MKPIDINIHSDTLDKTLEIAKPHLDKPLSTLSNGVTKCMEFFGAVIGPHMDQYIMEYPYKKEKLKRDLEQKYKFIPDEYKTEARINIAGPVFENLKYNLDEEHLKEMYENILISDMDNRKQSKVLPAYIDIVRQLSKADAEMLKFFKEENIIDEPVIKLKFDFSSGGFVYLSNNIELIHNNKNIVLDSIILDNLLRLKIIELDFDRHLHDTSIYETSFKEVSLRNEFKNLDSNVKKLNFSKGLITLTDFGKNFIDICLS